MPNSEKISSMFLEINSCGRQVLEGKDRVMMRKNGRVDYHLLYITKGVCYLGKEQRPVEAGHLIFFPPHTPQEYRFKGETPTVSHYIHFSGTMASHWLGVFGLSLAPTVYVGTPPELERIFTEMAEEQMMKRPHYKEACAALLLRFLAVAGRYAHYRAAAVSPALQRSMEAVCLHMREHCREHLNLSDYAAMCHLSVGRFSHVFRESMMESPGHYILRIRVEMARELLATTDLTVGEIAERVGIEDANYFSRLMKKYTGEPPCRLR